MALSKLAQAVLDARSEADVIAVLARLVWDTKHPGKEFPNSQILTPEDLAAWLPECPEAAQAEASRLLVRFFEEVRRVGMQQMSSLPFEPAPAGMVTDSEDNLVEAEVLPRGTKFEPVLVLSGLTGLVETWRWEVVQTGPADRIMIGLVEEGLGVVGSGKMEAVLSIGLVHLAWIALPEPRPKHPLGPIVRARMERSGPWEYAKTVTVGRFTKITPSATAGALADLDTPHEVETVEVDGHAVATKSPVVKTVAYLARRQRRVDGYLFPLAGLSRTAQPQDVVLRVVANLREEDGRRQRRVDVYRLAALGQALTRPVTAHIEDIAAWLAGVKTLRGMDFRRRARLEKRAWDALAWADCWIPDGRGGYNKLMGVEPHGQQVDIQPYRWQEKETFRLTGALIGGEVWQTLRPEGGQILAGMEDVIAASGPQSRQRRTPRLLVPTRNGGPGPYESVYAEELLVRSGFDVSEGLAGNARARKAWERFRGRAEAAGLVVPDGNLNKSSPAGKSGTAGVEIVAFKLGGKGHAAGVLIRATAARVEAQRIVESKRSQDRFAPVRLADLMRTE